MGNFYEPELELAPFHWPEFSPMAPAQLLEQETGKYSLTMCPGRKGKPQIVGELQNSLPYLVQDLLVFQLESMMKGSC